MCNERIHAGQIKQRKVKSRHFLDCQKPTDIPSWLLKLFMITSAGPTDKASKEPFGKNLYNQEYWASFRADASSNFILGCAYGERITKVVFM
ncbi:hypothetical protein SO802_034438 [Lithocarpus litseifolius]|uniref:Uncharacterized protein n=1 Tax=Lithocarpus litseifolius TaxID=425828 RepID=A0AAW2BHL3_9ROSI